MDEDSLMEDAVLYLQKKTYRVGASKNEKRIIRRKAERFALEAGELLYTKKDKTKVRYITNGKEKQQILEDCHCDITSGHMGIKKTLARITERFIWAGVAKDVCSLVQRCDTCQRMTKKIKTGTPELHPVPAVSTWYHLGIDFVGPLAHKSNQGNSFILTIVDYFSKFVQAIPCKSKEASTVCETLFQLFMQFGIPKVITTDQGKEFNNALDKEMMKQLNVNHRLTTPYHPQANGLVERFNQTIQNMLVKFVHEKKEEWENYLSTCVYAYNTSKNESSNFCPFTVMFGRSAVLPIDLKLSSDVIASPKMGENADELIEEHQIFRENMMEKVKANIIAAQARQKEQYNKKHFKPDIFTRGALVLRKDMKRKKRAGGKMDFKWLGPYRIIKSMGKGLYQIESTSQPTERMQRVHGIHLKPYDPPGKMVPMSSIPDEADTCASIDTVYMSKLSTDSLSGSEPSVEVPMPSVPDEGDTSANIDNIDTAYMSKLSTDSLSGSEPPVEIPMPSIPDEGDTSANIDNIDTAYMNKLSTDSLSGSEPSVEVPMSSVPDEGDTSANIDNIDTAYINRLSTDSLSGSEPSVEVPMSSVPNEGDTSVNIDNIDTAYVNRLLTDSLSDSEPSVKANSVKPLTPISNPCYSSTPNQTASSHKLVSPELAKNLSSLVDDVLLVSPALENLNQDFNIIDHILEEKSCKRKLIFSSPSNEKEVPNKRKRKFTSNLSFQDKNLSNVACDAEAQLRIIWRTKPNHVVKARIGNCSVYHGSFHTLKENGFLNDEIVNTYLKLLASIYQNSYVIVSQTLTAIINRMPSKNRFHLLSKEELGNRNFLLGLYNLGGIHWVLIVIDLQKHHFYYLDPFGPSRSVRGVFTAMKKYFKMRSEVLGKDIVNLHQFATLQLSNAFSEMAEQILGYGRLDERYLMTMNVMRARKEIATTLISNSVDMLDRCMLCGRADDSIDLDAYRHWVQCDHCDKWLHSICTGQSKDCLRSKEYKCPECSGNNNDFV